MSLPLDSLKVTPVVIIIMQSMGGRVIRRGVVSSPFFYILPIIFKLPRWRPFASSGLPRPSLPCDLIIGQPEGQQQGSCATL